MTLGAKSRLFRMPQVDRQRTSVPMRRRNLPSGLVVALALIVVPGLALVGLQTYQLRISAPQLTQNRAWVVHTFEVITTAQALATTVRDAERSQRRYLLSGEDSYLGIYQRAIRDVPVLLAKLRSLTYDNAEQQRRWPELGRQIDNELGELQRTLQLSTRHGFSAVQEFLRNEAHFDVMPTIDALLGAAIATERSLLAERLARTVADERSNANAARASAALAMVAMVLGVVLLMRAFNRALRAETARGAGERRFDLLIDGVADHALYMLDEQGHITDWNAGGERLKGYAATEIIGRHFSCFYTEGDRQANVPQQALDTAARTGKYAAEGWRVRKDGSRFFASVVLTALHDASGGLVGFAKITRDVTERVQQQRALEEARTALAQSQKMEALGQLTGGIAHDFNNLLHVIKNAVAIVLRRLPEVDPDVRRYLDMATQNADRAAGITQRLLAFSRQQPLEPKAIDPNKLLSSMTALLRSALGERIALETVLSAGIWTISADINQLETAILNLALNARDAISEYGKLTIETANAFLDESYAGVHAEVIPGQYVLIAVSDTGSGMPKEVAARAFEPFFTTKEAGRGTGLGLSQVFGFVKQSGGHVKIYSEPGQGTTVKLYLPRLAASAVDLGKESEPVVARTSGETILVVEDDEDVRTFSAEVLSELGYRVTVAPDAHVALTALGNLGAVDLLFTDVGLPDGINGRQLADEVQRRWPAVKVLFTTGYARNAIVHHGRLDPGVALIVKPFTQSSLAAKVRQVLDSGIHSTTS
jgi:PAS domain S-box-containing protein